MRQMVVVQAGAQESVMRSEYSHETVGGADVCCRKTPAACAGAAPAPWERPGPGVSEAPHESGAVAELAFVIADGEVVPPHALTAHRSEDVRLGTPA